MTMSVSEAGRKGGKAKVEKGFSKMTPEQRAANGRKGALARWGKKQPKATKKKSR